MGIQQETLMESIKSKVKGALLRKSEKKKSYVKMDKSASVRVEIRSQKLIDKILKVPDPPSKHTPLLIRLWDYSKGKQ
ncbi:unnamed protein product [Linum tenue]|uniref:Uncharacterized protein n=1 Tax=Linum tenue TaxID=586396 RepID=A0AAV0HXS6_9ROSI|nr:unnamed protein product [Linum tenue]